VPNDPSRFVECGQRLARAHGRAGQVEPATRVGRVRSFDGHRAVSHHAEDREARDGSGKKCQKDAATQSGGPS